jgi:hypothetical protein
MLSLLKEYFNNPKTGYYFLIKLKLSMKYQKVMRLFTKESLLLKEKNNFRQKRFKLSYEMKDK